MNKADLEELKIYLEHAKDSLIEGDETEARAFIDDAISKIKKGLIIIENAEMPF